MYRDGFLCPLSGCVMGETAESLAERYRIGREEQDAYAAQSQRRCEAARVAGLFADEIVAVEGVARDEHPRDGVTVESLARLKPVFKEGGTVHVGNSSGITDGAAAMLVTTAETAARHGIEPWARIRGFATVGVDPAIMGIGPVPAVRRLEERTGLRLEDMDLVELNEAFAAQVLACDRELGFDRERLNVNGGAIALGHPIGATGARIVVTLLHELRRRGARLGLATLCVSGGMGYAMPTFPSLHAVEARNSAAWRAWIGSACASGAAHESRTQARIAWRATAMSGLSAAGRPAGARATPSSAPACTGRGAVPLPPARRQAARSASAIGSA
jgi:acetyl-CoA C-acetyltransferase